MDINNIDELLSRFFDGTTTCAEERALQSYFASGNVAPQHRRYCEMFGWYASGMKEETLPDRAPAVRRRRRVFYRYAAAACAAIAVAVCCGLWCVCPQVPAYYADCCLVLDGHILKGEDEIGEVIAATFTEGDLLEAEIDNAMAAEK